MWNTHDSLIADADFSWTEAGAVGTGIWIGASSSGNEIRDVNLQQRSIALDINSDSELQISGVDFTGSATGLHLSGVDGAHLENLGTGLATTTTAVALDNSSGPVVNSVIANLDVSWDGVGLYGTGLSVGASCFNNEFRNITVHGR